MIWTDRAIDREDKLQGSSQPLPQAEGCPAEIRLLLPKNHWEAYGARHVRIVQQVIASTAIPRPMAAGSTSSAKGFSILSSLLPFRALPPSPAKPVMYLNHEIDGTIVLAEESQNKKVTLKFLQTSDAVLMWYQYPIQHQLGNDSVHSESLLLYPI